jgi:hypothetical protein
MGANGMSSKPDYCFVCWRERQVRTETPLVLDDEPYCLPHARQAGYSDEEITAALPAVLKPGNTNCCAECASEGCDGTEKYCVCHSEPDSAPAPTVDVNERNDVRTKNSPPPARRSPGERAQCAADDCGKRLNVNNRTGYCSKHFYQSKAQGEKPAPSVKRATSAPKPAKAKAIVLASAPRAEMVTISVPVNGLDLWWARLQPAEKAAALSAYLQSARN